MNLNTNVGVGAILKLVVRKADTGEIVRETPEFHNLVLTTGLERMAVGAWVDRCCIGTGNSTPVASQVALDNFLASTTAEAVRSPSVAGIQVTDVPFYWHARRIWRFDVGVATGNISEVGLGWGDSSLWNRALIKDINGNPATITVLADEYLDVISEIRVYPEESTGSFNLVDKLGNIISNHTYLARPRFSSRSSVGAAWVTTKVQFAVIGTGNPFGIGISNIPTTPTGEVVTAFTTGALAHQPLSNGLKASKVISSTEANIGSHKSFSTALLGLVCGGGNLGAYSCGYNWEIDPPIPKDDETILTYSFTLTWGNHVP